MKILYSIVFVNSLVLFSAGKAESADITDLINGEKVQWKFRNYRVSLAESIESILLTFNHSIPNLSPDQKAWLTAERTRIDSIKDDGSKMEQLEMLFNSAAFLTDRAKQGIDKQLLSIRCIKYPKVSLPTEIACWGNLSLLLQDELVFDSIQQLDKKQIASVPRSTTINGFGLIINVKSFGWSYWPEAFGEGILEYIILPYLVENQKSK